MKTRSSDERIKVVFSVLTRVEQVCENTDRNVVACWISILAMLLWFAF